MKGSVLQKQHATALARSPKLFLEDTPFLRYILITKLAGVGKLLRFAEPNEGCELTEERSDAWEPHISNPGA